MKLNSNKVEKLLQRRSYIASFSLICDREMKPRTDGHYTLIDPSKEGHVDIKSFKAAAKANYSYIINIHIAFHLIRKVLRNIYQHYFIMHK